MNDTRLHPMSEAKVQVRRMDEDWRDSLDLDPVMLPVERYGLTDAFNATVIGLVDSIIQADTPLVGTSSPAFEYRVVWSDSGQVVKAVCPICDDVFPIAEGAPGDEWNEDYDAIFCGCDHCVHGYLQDSNRDD